MGRKNKHYFIDTDRPKVNNENYIQLLDAYLLPDFILETIMYFTKIGPLLTQVG